MYPMSQTQYPRNRIGVICYTSIGIETYLLLYCLITQKSIMISVRCYITGMASGVFDTVCITPAF